MIFLTLIAIVFITYLVILDKSITNRSISFSYYEGRETDILWGSFASMVGASIWFLFPEVIPRIAATSLILVPIFGNFQKKPITYFHYAFAGIFFGLMLFYTRSISWIGLVSIIPFYLYVKLVQRKKFKLSTFWWEIIGMSIILGSLWFK
tara:strand:- start:15 stop:464 length:450 start_codon:yes stop_codon:yes gene_type:complete